MITSKKILKNLERQEKIEGPTENIRLVRFFLSKIKRASQWTAFIRTEHHRYGTLSYQTYKFYYCSDELLALIKGAIDEIKELNG